MHHLKWALICEHDQTHNVLRSGKQNLNNLLSALNFLPSSSFFVFVIQSDVPEVCGAAAAETSALQKHPAGATVRRTLEVSGRRHPGAAHRTERRELLDHFYDFSLFF